MPVGQHLLGLETLQQTPPNKGAQDAFTQAGLRLGHDIRIHAGGRVEDDTRRVGLIRGLRTGLSVRISIALARHFLKHAIDCADVEVNNKFQVLKVRKSRSAQLLRWGTRC